MTATTKHNHPANFGRKVDGCPRCAELVQGASPIRWNAYEQKRADEAARLRAIRSHDCVASRCGIVCTFGEW